jgi:hypothetical protein
MMELHLKETIEDMLDKLLIIEDQNKEPKRHNLKHAQGKLLKNPCCLHKGGHKWDDCSAEKTQRIKEISSRQAATITVIIIGIILSTKIMENYGNKRPYYPGKKST